MFDDLFDKTITKTKRKTISVSLDEDLLNEIDTFLKRNKEKRIKRSSFIEYLFKKFLEEQKKVRRD